MTTSRPVVQAAVAPLPVMAAATIAGVAVDPAVVGVDLVAVGADSVVAVVVVVGRSWRRRHSAAGSAGPAGDDGGGTGGGTGLVGGIGGGAANIACSSGTVCAGDHAAIP